MVSRGKGQVPRALTNPLTYPAFARLQIRHGSGRDRPMTTLLIFAAWPERLPSDSGGADGSSPGAMSWRILARSSTWFIRDKQQKRSHGAISNIDAMLERGAVSPSLELAGLSTLRRDQLMWRAPPSAGRGELRTRLSSCSDDWNELRPLPVIPPKGSGKGAWSSRYDRCPSPRSGSKGIGNGPRPSSLPACSRRSPTAADTGVRHSKIISL